MPLHIRHGGAQLRPQENLHDRAYGRGQEVVALGTHALEDLTFGFVPPRRPVQLLARRRAVVYCSAARACSRYSR
jgi:hypothetical protein